MSVLENIFRIQILLRIMTSLQVEPLEPLSLGPGVLRCRWCFGARSVVLQVGLLAVWRCPLLGQVPCEVAPWVNGSLRSWPSGSSAETSSCTGYSCSEERTCSTRFISKQGLIPLHSSQSKHKILVKLGNGKGVTLPSSLMSPKKIWGFRAVSVESWKWWWFSSICTS